MMIEKLKAYNQIFMQNYSHGNEKSEEIFVLTDRGSTLILSAPHATQSFTNKHDKKADLYTGALAQYLGEITNTSTLIRTKYTPYKALISDYVIEHHLENHYFLDIHGFKQDIDFDICLGIADFDNKLYPYLEDICSTAKKYGLKVAVNHPDYTGRAGLTGRFQKAFQKPNVIQIELKPHLRDFFNSPETVQNITIPFFTDVIALYK